MACPSSVVSPFTVNRRRSEQSPRSFFLPLSGSKIEHVQRWLPERQTALCGVLPTAISTGAFRGWRDFGRKRCGDRWEGWSNRRLGSATSNGKSVGSARGFVLSCTEKRPPPMEMASSTRGKGSGWAKGGGIRNPFGSARETAALHTH